jgi:hypothetical protein
MRRGRTPRPFVWFAWPSAFPQIIADNEPVALTSALEIAALADEHEADPAFSTTKRTICGRDSAWPEARAIQAWADGREAPRDASVVANTHARPATDQISLQK